MIKLNEYNILQVMTKIDKGTNANNAEDSLPKKGFLKSMDIEYTEVNVSTDPSKLMEVVAISGMMTVPQIFVWEPSKDTLIGGYDEMIKLHEDGKFLEKIK